MFDSLDLKYLILILVIAVAYWKISNRLFAIHCDIAEIKTKLNIIETNTQIDETEAHRT